MDGVHDGHRKRLRERFEETGLRGFAPHEALELILFYAIPRRDTNSLAHELIRTFGSFRGVLEADVDELKKIAGIGDSSALLIHLMLESYRYYERDSRDDSFTASSIKATKDYIMSLYVGERNEKAYLLSFDSSQRLITCSLVSEGSVTVTEVSARKVAELATRYNAVSVILCHNHPDGVAMPSAGDMTVTKKLIKLLDDMGINLCDHIIVAGNGSLSLAEAGCIHNLKCELGIEHV